MIYKLFIICLIMKEILFVIKNEELALRIRAKSVEEFVEKLNEEGLSMDNIDWSRTFRCL